MFTLKGHTGFVLSAAFSPDGTRIVTGSGDHTAKVWDAQTGRELLTLKGHTDAVWSAAFSPDGTRIVTGSGDHTAKVWNAQTGRELLTLKGHTDAVGSAAFSPDGRRIVTASFDHTAKVWEADMTLTRLDAEQEPSSASAAWRHVLKKRLRSSSPPARRGHSGSDRPEQAVQRDDGRRLE